LYLTREEERMLAGDFGEAAQIAMRLLVRVGEALGAQRLIPITHAHVSGISYFNIGDAGLEFIEELAADGRVKVFSTFNPVGVPLEVNTNRLPATRDELLKQDRIIRALLRMGFKYTATCIPYMLRRPRLGEHLAWGESSAVAVANTLYGARTNREGGPIALAAAITGRIYEWGLHIDGERRANILVSFTGSPLDALGAGLLGYMIGQTFGSGIPYIDATISSTRGVIQMCAAAAASGSIAMCVVRGYSPEDRGPPRHASDKMSLNIKDLTRLRRDLEGCDVSEAEAYFTGCPHHWYTYVSKAVAIAKRYGKLTAPIYIAVPANIPSWLRKLASRLSKSNIYIIPGTCHVVAKISELYSRVATDSLKAAFYLPRRHKVSIALASLEEFARSHRG